jgi:hypothetical protein
VRRFGTGDPRTIFRHEKFILSTGPAVKTSVLQRRRTAVRYDQREPVLRSTRPFVPLTVGGSSGLSGGHDFARVAVSSPSVQAGAPIQRVLNVNSANVPQDIRKALRKSTRNFNNYGQANLNTQHALHQQFAMLDAIERRVNTHLRDNSASVTDTQRQELFGLLAQTQQHHEGLTQRNVAAGNDLWIRNASQLGGPERQRRQNLWRSLTTGAGNVKTVTRSNAFRNQVHSGFAQLLQGQHGTDMLADLNRAGQQGEAQGAARHVVISDNHADDLRDLYAHHRVNNSPDSWAEAHAGAAGPGGSQVQIQEGGPPATLGEHESDPTGRAIFAPRYITLGHELGHARHIMQGTLRANQWYGPEPELAGQARERKLWTNPEEYVNITTEENPLRAEHDLPQRKYHGTINATNARNAEHDLRSRFEALHASVPAQHQRAINPHFGQVNAVLNRTDFGNAGHIATATTHLDQLSNNLPGMIRAERWKSFKAGVSSALTPTRGKVAALATGAVGLAGLGLAWWNRQNG